MRYIDDFLNTITMYRLILYYLVCLLLVATVFGCFGILAYNPIFLLLGSVVIVIVSVLTNDVCARLFRAPKNVESVYITALILALIIPPMRSLSDTTFLVFALWASIFAMASKYIFAINKKHLFNPAAIAVVLTGFGLNLYASWWVGTAVMLPFVLVGGFLVVRKIQRADLVWSFLTVACITILLPHMSTIPAYTKRIALETPVFFFAFVMLTEPLTTPPTRFLRILYGAFVGFLFSPLNHIGNVYSTPELALVVGNIFSYAVSPKSKAILTLQETTAVTPTIRDFVFTSDTKFSFEPGQYLEWTLAHDRPDNRGNRRYFTIASSPEEDTIRLGVKFYKPASSFKTALGKLKAGDTSMSASSLAGDFVLPKDRTKKLVFIAGGIGITPFRSMVKHLMFQNEKRDIVLLYSTTQNAEIAYTDVFMEAKSQLQMTLRYVITREQGVDTDEVHYGRIDEAYLKKHVPDFHERYFYISGTHEMVTHMHEVLRMLGIHENHVRTDFFPGFV